MNQEYHFNKLQEIRAKMPNDQKQFSTAGLIVDCTNPHRKDTKKDYCMRLKIIDPNHPNDLCSVFLYAKTAEQFPKKIKIGDILVLHKFGFEMWNDVFQAKKHFKIMGSFFRFFSGQPSSDSYSSIDNQIGLDDSQGKILDQIKKLRAGSKTLFSKATIPLYTKNNKKSSDFDLILKVNNCLKNDSNSWKVQMTNTVNDFQINYCEEVPAGVYKIRSIADLSWENKKCHLVGNDYTCFLEIPNWMKSHQAKEWQKIVSVKSQTKAERDRIGSKISGQKKNDKRKHVTLKELVERDSHNEQVKISCEFVQSFTSFERALKKYDAKNFTEKGFQSSQGEYIYNAHFAITDKSLNGQLFNIYVYSYDGRGNQFFTGIDPKKVYGKNVLQSKERYDHLMNRLLEQSDYDSAPIELVLSPMNNGRDTIYRIVDTQLLL